MVADDKLKKNIKKQKRTKRIMPKTLPPDFYGNIAQWAIVSITPFKICAIDPIKELTEGIAQITYTTK
jgi:hypothetical protein